MNFIEIFTFVVFPGGLISISTAIFYMFSVKPVEEFHLEGLATLEIMMLFITITYIATVKSFLALSKRQA